MTAAPDRPAPASPIAGGRAHSHSERQTRSRNAIFYHLLYPFTLRLSSQLESLSSSLRSPPLFSRGDSNGFSSTSESRVAESVFEFTSTTIILHTHTEYSPPSVGLHWNSLFFTLDLWGPMSNSIMGNHSLTESVSVRRPNISHRITQTHSPLKGSVVGLHWIGLYRFLTPRPDLSPVPSMGEIRKNEKKVKPT